MTLLNLVKLPITTIDLSPGSHLLINAVTWEQYETLLADLGGDRRVPRLNGSGGNNRTTATAPSKSCPPCPPTSAPTASLPTS